MDVDCVYNLDYLPFMISCEPTPNGYRLYMGQSVIRPSEYQKHMQQFPKEAFLAMRNRCVYELENCPSEWNYVLENGFDFEVCFSIKSIVVGYSGEERTYENMTLAHYYVTLSNEDAIHYRMFVELPKK